MIYTAANSFDDIRDRTIADFGCGCGMLSIAAALMGAEKVYSLDIDSDALIICKRNLEDLGIIDLEDSESERESENKSVNVQSDNDNLDSETESFISSTFSVSETTKNACMMEELGTDDEIIPSTTGPLVELFIGDILDESFLKSTLASKGNISTVLMNPPFGTKNNAGIDVAFVKAGLSLARSNPLRAIYSMHKSSTREHLKRKAEDWNVSFTVIAEMKFDLPAKYSFHKKDNVTIQVDLLRFGINDW